MTQKDFAPLLGIQQAHYSQIEKGLRPLTVAQHRALVNRFSLPPDFFTEAPVSYGPASLNFRRRKLSAKQVSMATATFGVTEQYITANRGPVEHVPMSDGPAKSKRPPEEIASFAHETRQLIGMADDKAVNNVTKCMQRIGIEVVPLANPQLDLTKIDGISTPIYRFKPFVSTLNYQVPGDRFRFSAAHELGHIMLHSNGHDGSLADREAEADRFAAEFLMPRSVFSQILSPDLTLNAFAQLKASWGVSIQALIRRSYDLGFIDRERYRSLNIQVANRGWKKKEPVEIPVEKPLNPCPPFLSGLSEDMAHVQDSTLAQVFSLDDFRNS